MPAAKTSKNPKKMPTSSAAASKGRTKTSLPVFDSFPLRAAFVVVGVVGLAALGLSLFGPRRFRDEILRPIGAATYLPVATAVAPQADRVWAETRAWRDRFGHVLQSINTEDVRQLVASRLAQWIERFR